MGPQQAAPHTGPVDDRAGPVAPARRTLWEEGRHPGALVVTAAAAALALVTLLDVAALSGPGVLFGMAFVVVSVGAALLVRPSDTFVVGVAPPLLMLGVVVVLAAWRPGSVAQPDDGTVQAVVSGLSHHSIALGVGYGLCLAVLGVRDRFARGLLRPGFASRLGSRRVRSGPGRPPRPAAPPEHPATSRRRSWARPGSRRPR